MNDQMSGLMYIKLVKWWQQTCWIVQNAHVVDTIALVLVLQYLTNPSFMVLSSLVRRHDRPFIVHLLEPAINRCLYSDLCNLGVWYRYGRFWSSSDISHSTDAMNWLWLFTIVSSESPTGIYQFSSWKEITSHGSKVKRNCYKHLTQICHRKNNIMFLVTVAILCFLLCGSQEQPQIKLCFVIWHDIVNLAI